MRPSLERVLFLGGGVAGGALMVAGLMLGHPLAVLVGLAWLLGTWGVEGYRVLTLSPHGLVRSATLLASWLGLGLGLALVVLLLATGVWERPQDWARTHPWPR